MNYRNFCQKLEKKIRLAPLVGHKNINKPSSKFGGHFEVGIDPLVIRNLPNIALKNLGQDGPTVENSENPDAG